MKKNKKYQVKGLDVCQMKMLMFEAPTQAALKQERELKFALESARQQFLGSYRKGDQGRSREAQKRPISHGFFVQAVV